jgi:branched-subunit amino acid ABC-type transport system permease component
MDFLYDILIDPWVQIFIAPLFFGEVVIGGLLAGVMYSLVALGFVLIFKASGVFNFAQGVMVLFAALSLVGLIERGIPLLPAIALTAVIMLMLAVVIERVILRYMVNQEPIILFMATIGLTYFLEGFGETLWGSDVKRLDVGIPDTALDFSRLAIANYTVVWAFVGALSLSLLLLFFWRVHAVRATYATTGGTVAGSGNGSRVWTVLAAFGLVLFLQRFLFGADAAFIGGKASATATFVASLSVTGLIILFAAGFFFAAQRVGAWRARSAVGEEVPPMHYVWFVLLGIAVTIGTAAGVIWAARAGILINAFELFAAAMATVLVLVLALFFQKTRIGRALRAVADDHAAALSVGISLRGIWIIVWAVAGIVALAAGIIWGGKSGVQFSLSLIALKALPVLILGGFTSVPGAIVGGLIIGVGEKVAEVYWGPAVGGAIENWFAYILALVFLLFRPQGLFGEKIIERV